MFLLRAVSAVYYIRSVFLNRYRFFNILQQHIRNFNVFQASVHVSAVLLEQCTHRINFIWAVFILLWMIHYNSWTFRIQTYENMPAFKCRQISAVVFRMFFFIMFIFWKKSMKNSIQFIMRKTSNMYLMHFYGLITYENISKLFLIQIS